ncbi:MAG: hypothetical protein K2Y22_10340 [Candidatus Obscuribacterales bacterium]|nr:hypothetical protein [Candidatus Obscuribacterales bacterium]
MTNPKKKKIVVIGAIGLSRVTDSYSLRSFSWDSLHSVNNLSDYDFVIINLLPPRPSLYSHDWTKFFEKLTFRTFLNVASHDGLFIIIGDPRLTVPVQPQQGGIVDIPFLNWTGLTFTWGKDGGDTVYPTKELAQSQFAPYIAKLKQWDYFIDKITINRNVLTAALGKEYHHAIDVKFDETSLANTRFHKSLALYYFFHFSARISESEFTDGMSTWKRLAEAQTVGPVILLPDLGIGSDETIHLVLNDVLNLRLSNPEPAWLQDYVAPGQDVIDSTIRDIDAQINSLQVQHTTKIQERVQSRRCLRLLFDVGTNLEEIVKEVLNDLGAIVHEPTEKNKEDGWITVEIDGNILEGVLEVKSTERPNFDESGLRQLMDWKNRGKLKQKLYKGIFIGSNSVKLHPSERSEGFGHSLIETAKIDDLVTIKCDDLYCIYQLQKLALLDQKLFWKQLFETKGVFNASQFRKQLEENASLAEAAEKV